MIWILAIVFPLLGHAQEIAQYKTHIKCDIAAQLLTDKFPEQKFVCSPLVLPGAWE
jgi:hypothetical protein